MKTLFEILKSCRVLHNLEPIDDFPGGGGGGGDAGTNQGGTGGGTSGTTSGIIIPTLTLTPSTDQSVAIGTTTCFTASGTFSLTQESEQNAIIDLGCSLSSTGTWMKTCGTNNAPDAECHNSRLLYRKQPFGITGTNGSFVGATPGSPTNNTHLFIGVKSTNGYYFYWDIFKYCNATSGNCGSNWLGYVKVNYPDGTIQTLSGGLIEFNQQFRVKSDGTRIIWEYTTYNNWAYGYYSLPIPSDSGDFQFFVNALWMNNTWNNLKTYRGSYQGVINSDEFIWTSNCIDNIEINGNEACFTPTSPGSCNICVTTTNATPVCVDVVASPLYLNPIDKDCNNCNDNIDCLNIPNPTKPIISIDSILNNTININWENSISFTTGLYYEIDVNGDIQKVLDNNITLSELEDGNYIFKVRAIDDCGESDWSDEATINIDSFLLFPAAPTDFLVEYIEEDGQYKATWVASLGAVEYEIWIGDPQTMFLISSTDTIEYLGTLMPGLKLSVKAKDSFDVYSDFSNIVTI